MSFLDWQESAGHARTQGPAPGGHDGCFERSRPRPIPSRRFLVIEENPDASERITDELRRRYANDYDIVAEPACDGGRTALRSLQIDGAQIAVVLCDIGQSPDSSPAAGGAFRT